MVFFCSFYCPEDENNKSDHLKFVQVLFLFFKERLKTRKMMCKGRHHIARVLLSGLML